MPPAQPTNLAAETLGALLMLPIFIVIHTFVLWFGYHWFLIPAGLPPLSFVQIAGIAALINYLKGGGRADEPLMEMIPKIILWHATSFVLLWVISLFR